MPILGIALAAANFGQAQPTYILDWSTIAGGGGTWSGGGYRVEATIGQPDAGTMAGGTFLLKSGFWPGPFLEDPTTNQPPAILQQPVSLTVREGSNATFSVIATGTQPLSYQWRQNDVGMSDPCNARCSGSRTASLTISNVQSGDAGNYSVEVTNLYGSSTSSNATLTVIGPPRLVITYANGHILISWPAPSTGFELWENSNLNTQTWVKAGMQPVIVNGRKQVDVGPVGGFSQSFYRLECRECPP